MARCFSPRLLPYDPTKSQAGEQLLTVISKDLGHLTSFTSWGPDGFHMPFLELFIGFWGVHRETCVVEGVYSRALKELVAAAVSAISSCNFCANAHGLCAQAAGMQAAMKVIQQKDPSLIADEHARSVIEWTLNIYKPQANNIKNPPMNEEEAAELIGTVFATIYMNVITHNFVSDRAIPPKLPNFIRNAYEKDGAFKALISKVAVKVLKKDPAKPGDMDKVYEVLPGKFEEEQIELPSDLNWVNGNEFIKRNMKFWYWSVTEGCNAIVQPSLRNLVTDFMLKTYRCEAPDQSPREWASEIIDRSPYGKFVTENQDRLWAELMLVVGTDPTKLITCNVLQDFRLMYPGELGEQKLKAGVVLAAFLRARRVCSFLGAFLD